MKKYLLTALIVMSLLSTNFLENFGHKTEVAQAQNTGVVSGWLWSDTIGWVSLNCTNIAGSCANASYAVTQNADGTWTGYGWADTVGWLQFGGGCPVGAAGNCNAEMDNNALKGWAKFISAGNGWDGWVSLSSTNDNDLSTPGVQTSPHTYGAVLSGTTAAGYAWGSDIVGWLVFSNVTVDTTPVSTISASDCIIAAGASSCTNNVSWTTTGLANGSVTAITRNIGTPASFTPSPLTFGSITRTLEGVGPVEFYLYNNAVLLAQDTGTASCAQGTSWNGTICQAGAPSVSLNAAPGTVATGGSSVLSWTSSNVTSCTASASPANASWTGSKAVNSVYPHESTGSLFSTTTFTIVCTGALGSATDSATVTVSNIGSNVTASISANPSNISLGGSSTLTWGSNNATSCTGTNFSTGGATSGTLVVSPVVTTIYKVSCTDGSDSAQAQTIVSLKKKFLFIEF
jgi:hypothetical protein